MARAITKEEYEKIKLMESLKTSVIVKLTGRGHSTIERIKQSKDWDGYCDIKIMTHSQLPVNNQSTISQLPAREELKETEQNTPPHLLDDNLLLRIADGIDYSNALMNGVVAKLDALIKALGV